MVVKKTGGDFALPEAGMVQAVCSHIYDIGLQRGEYKGEEKITHQCVIMWELEERIKDGDHAGKRFTVSKFYTASLSEKANLRKDLASWRGRDFTEQELLGFELDNIIGVNCYLNLIVKKKKNGDDTIAVAAIAPFKRKEGGPIPMERELPSDYVPDWVKKLIDGSVKEGQATQPDTSGIESNDEIPF